MCTHFGSIASPVGLRLTAGTMGMVFSFVNVAIKVVVYSHYLIGNKGRRHTDTDTDIHTHARTHTWCFPCNIIHMNYCMVSTHLMVRIRCRVSIAIHYTVYPGTLVKCCLLLSSGSLDSSVLCNLIDQLEV